MFNFFKKNHTEAKLFFSTDIHSHLVPGVDDGSKDFETSLALLKGINELGITRSIITPHVTLNTFENTPEIINPLFNELKAKAKDAQIDVELGLSAEYRVDDFFEREVLQKDKFMLYPNNYILIENSFIQQALNFEQIVFDLKVKGLKPILAHPERYLYYAQKKERYKELHSFEILFQCNLLSFAGYYGKEVKEIAYWLLDNNLINFIGSDMHNFTHLNTIKEFCQSRECHKLAEKLDIMNETVFV